MSVHDTIYHISHYLSQHTHYGYAFAFGLAFLESLAVIGSIIPGSITMTALGVMVGSGILFPWLTFALCTLGALAGDMISFYIGVIYKSNLIHIWPFSRYPNWLEKGKRFFSKYGIAALIIGRFFGPMRSMVPLIAGVLHMPPRQFTFGIVPSALLWSIVYLTPGILLGALSTSFPSTIAIEILIDGALMIVAFWAIWEFINICYHGFAHYMIQLSHHLIDKLQHTEKGKKCHQLLDDPLNPNKGHQIYSLLICAMAIGLFCLTAYSVHVHGFITAFDQPLYHFFQSLQTPSMLTWTGIMAVLGHYTTLTILMSLLSLSFLIKKQFWRAFHTMALLATICMSTHLAKHFLVINRPSGLTDLWHSFSFPSGHTAVTTAVILFLCMLLKQHPKQGLIRMFGWSWIIAVGISRMLMGAHWLSDIIGGILLGIAVSKCIITCYQARHRPAIQAQPLLNHILLFFLLSAAIMLPIEFPKLDLPPTGPQKQLTIDHAQWWSQKKPELFETYRQNRFGVSTAPFNVQIFGNLHGIESQLVSLGWKTYPAAGSMSSMIMRHSNPSYHLPLINLLHHNQAPSLIMIKTTDPTVILRIWASSQHMKPDEGLWYGTVNRIRPDYHRFLPHWRFSRWRDFRDGIDALAPLSVTFQSKKIQLSSESKAHSNSAYQHKNIPWNGKILLLDLTHPPSLREA